jgi:hypothetical protein
MREPWKAGFILAVAGVLATLGCHQTPVDTSEYAQGPAPQRMPSPGKEAEGGRCYEDSLTGGQIFTMYCSYCHNAPALAERPFSNFQNVATHMRVRANLTGKEYAKLMEFLRRWHDVPPPHPANEPGPKRFFFSQPTPELREQPAAPGNPGQAEEQSEEEAPKAGQP